MPKSEYFRKPEMYGKKPFRCYNCDKKILNSIEGSVYKLAFKCPRCKCELTIKCNEVIPLQIVE